MSPLGRNWTLITSLTLIPLGIIIQLICPLNYFKFNLFHMSPESLESVFATRAAELREYIFAQPASTFKNNPWALATAIETFANTKRHMMIFRDKKLDVARAQLAAQQPAPRTILEFGTFVGKSALAWAAILRDIHGESVPAGVNVYTFELDPQMVSLARDLVRLAGVDDVVHVLEGPASESLTTLHARGVVTSVDMAFFDHWEQFYLPDLRLVEDLGLFRVGSLVIADNTDFPGAPEYLKYVKSGGRLDAGSVRYESVSYETETQRGKPVSFVSCVDTWDADADGSIECCGSQYRGLCELIRL
ncbi:S-adenosyl-L-methionine-dependent methyltransferase [Penicillium capsulatum]|uniref:catechol O-methyltransferase n=1 Tax=Penicillium capsulatum TaxID=69766 RepID=A0A9W9IXX6_9EURO|nr:S-adenosyl-L-methionine-dependent methyltransferase [Penicillium capsulatum]KAJ6129415.1 S-adenosyl-L-methionine-dependent methyltransferase [Penicillium capsulatum]